jgi:hypothetical protein
MKLINSDTYRDLAKMCLDIGKYIITVAILAPFFKTFSNPKIMYISALLLFILVVFMYFIFNFLSEKK